MNLVKYLTYILLLLIGSSCSFKSEGPKQKEDSKPVDRAQDRREIARPDLDKDGLSDDLEKELTSDPTKAFFPEFRVKTLRESKLEIRDFTEPSSKVEVKFEKTDDLVFDTVREKMALHAYQRAIGQGESPTPIDVFDLGVIKLSNFSFHDLQRLRNFIINNEDHIDESSITITSRFSLEAKNLLGITKVSQIKAELGVLEENGDFTSLGNIFDLLNVSNTRVIINNLPDNKSSVSALDVLIYVDHLALDAISHILDNELQLALKIVDYEVETSEGGSYRFSDQVQKAQGVGSLVALATPENTTLFFNATTEDINTTLNGELGETRSDGEGTLLSTQSYESDSFYPITFEEGGNQHLKQSSWFLFSQNDKLTDIPNIGETVMVGFFKNQYLAKVGKRLVSNTSKTLKGEAVSLDINNLKIGETLELTLSGTYLVPIQGAPIDRVSEAEVTKTRCESERDPGGGRFKRNCFDYKQRGWCGYKWSELTHQTKSYSKREDLLSMVHLYAQWSKNPIPLTNSTFFKKNGPILDSETNEWKLEIKIDENFIELYGESISVVYPKVELPNIKIGFKGYTDCGHRNLGRDFHFLDFGIREHSASGNIIHEPTIKLKRIFK